MKYAVSEDSPSQSLRDRGVAALRRLASSTVIPTVLGTLLLAASLLKGQELANRELDEQTLFGSRSFLTLLMVFELGLGLWLVVGLAASPAKWLATLAFIAFFEAAFHEALVGKHSCRCFGMLAVDPSFAMAIDLAAIVAIVVWQPAGYCECRVSSSIVAGGAFVVFVGVGLLAVISVIDYAPVQPMVKLRKDPRLGASIAMNLSNPTTEQMLHRIRESSRIELSIEPGLVRQIEGKGPDYGEISTSRAPAWSLMELVARKQPVPARWDKMNGGYMLVRAAPMGRAAPWLVAGLVLLVTVSSSIVVRHLSRGPVAQNTSQGWKAG